MQVNTTSAEVGSLVTSTEATNLMLNGRNYIQLIALSPGVSQTVASGFALFGTYGVSSNAQSVNGGRTDTANYFIDGVDNKDNGGGGNNFVNISPDALDQFRTASSAYDASYGGSSGATISVAIKNGTQQFHGIAYEYLRNDAIQAYAFQPLGTVTPVKPPLRYNNFGWFVGGPIYIPGHFNTNKDKLFFFVGQDFKRQRTSTVATLAVPTAAQRTSLPPCSSSVTTGCSTATGRALVNLFPASNTSDGKSFNYLSLNPLNTQEYLFKIDYNVNSKNQISGHYVHDLYTGLGAPTGLITFQRHIPGLTSSVQWTRTINAKTLNTLTVSFSGNLITESQGIAPNGQLGITSILRSAYNLNYPTLFNFSPDIPSVTTTGFSTLTATAINFDNCQRIYAAKDDFSRIIGNHSLKAGVYVWRGRKNQTSIPAINGNFGFTSIQNELMGNFSTYQEGSSIQQVQARFSQVETYVQDDWTVNHRLTINMGLRWQYMQPIFSALNNASAFDPNYYDPTHAATVNAAGIITSNPYPYNGLVLPGAGFPAQAQGRVSVVNNPQVLALFHNLPLGLVNTYWNTEAPRIGFAYDTNGKQTTVIHGGFGISYERLEGNYYYNSVAQLPFTTVANISNGNADTLTSASSAAANPSTITNSYDRNLQPPRVMNWSVGVQQKLANDTIAEINYVGSSSGNLTYYKNINQLPGGTLQQHPGISPQALRPYLGYQDIFQSTNGAISNYNSLQAHLQKRINNGGTVNVSYTWSKSLTDAQDYNYNPQDSFNLRADYGPQRYNQPQILVISYVYPLPFWQEGGEWYKKALGKWQISGITRISSGLPINVTLPTNSANSGDGVTSVALRPNLVGDPRAGVSGKQFLNSAAFATPTPGTFGNFQAYGVKGPTYDNWDVSLQKTFPIFEQLGVDFRAEMFNAPNHLSYFTIAAPAVLGTSNFGQVTVATDPRTMEFALRIHF
ncbi:carboxypeptidase regulatory-like domain-containing protein [Granulicella sp. WH15]|uniref:carboxypeptidase regulatory-like domain-containing protein n=1 Tax=Granulicella sp. WH15 TaxID=2602070 RepID=UPI001C70AA4D|nr:carboxypeptidase regulatory-like domain-containing protein [Granulicella sp. WH15]